MRSEAAATSAGFRKAHARACDVNAELVQESAAQGALVTRLRDRQAQLDADVAAEASKAAGARRALADFRVASFRRRVAAVVRRRGRVRLRRAFSRVRVAAAARHAAQAALQRGQAAWSVDRAALASELAASKAAADDHARRAREAGAARDALAAREADAADALRAEQAARLASTQRELAVQRAALEESFERVAETSSTPPPREPMATPMATPAAGAEVAFTPAGQAIFEQFWARAATARKPAAAPAVTPLSSDDGCQTSAALEEQVPTYFGLEGAFGAELTAKLPETLREKIRAAGSLLFAPVAEEGDDEANDNAAAVTGGGLSRRILQAEGFEDPS